MLKIKITIIMGLLTIFVCAFSQENNLSINSEKKPETDNQATVESKLNSDVVNGLLKMYEEEKMARDLYLEFLRLWNQKIFRNIAKSEIRHMHAVSRMLDFFDIDAKELKKLKSGQYSDENIRNLYEKLINEGNKSQISAFKQGAMLEEIDIGDLNTELAKKITPELMAMYKNLLSASEDHLRAYVRVLERRGVEYYPQILKLSEYETILSERNEDKDNEILNVGCKNN